MSNLEQLHLICAEQGIELRGDPIIDPDRNAFFNVELKWDSRGRRTPSHRALAKAESAVEALGLAPKFLLYSDKLVDLEIGLRATLLTAHPAFVRNVFASLEDKRIVGVWIEAKSSGAREESEQITDTVRKYFEPSGIRLGKVSWLIDAHTPSKLAILSTIRRLAPVTFNNLKASLVASGFEVPSNDWLLRALDRFRKADGVVRTAGGKYALTYRSLMQLGTVKDASSPDISRLLAIAKSCA